MPADDGAGAGTVDVNVTGHKFGFDALDVGTRLRNGGGDSGQIILLPDFVEGRRVVR